MRHPHLYFRAPLSVLLFGLLFVSVACDTSADESITSRADLNLVGDWEIERFIADGVLDNTDDYQNMVFNFGNNSSITVSRADSVLTTGSCDETQIDHDGDGESSLALDMVFLGLAPFTDLVEEWVVLDVEDNGNLIRLIEGVSQQTPERLDLRRL